MAIKEIEGRINYVKFTDKDTKEPLFKKGELVCEGVFENEYKDKEYGNLRYQIRTESGLVDIRGAGHLSYMFRCGGVELGDYVVIKYDGLGDKVIKGNRPHNFKVGVDKEYAKEHGPADAAVEEDPWDGDDVPL